MALDLPLPMKDKLVKSPLSLVVCQVRHEEISAVSDANRVLQLHSEVKNQYPLLEQQYGQSLTISAGPGGVQQDQQRLERGWRMKSSDGWNVVIMPNFFSLETTSYTEWEEFRERTEIIIQLISKILSPQLEQRIGIRYINHIRVPGVNTPRSWLEKIDAAFLGPIGHEVLGSAVVENQQVTQFDLAEGRVAIVRHGTTRDISAREDNYVYIIDQDCFSQRGHAFRQDDVCNEVAALHTLQLQVFQQAITGKFLEYLRGE